MLGKLRMSVFLDLGGATPDMVDPGGVSGVLVDAVGLSINFEDAMGVFWDLGGIWGATPTW